MRWKPPQKAKRDGNEKPIVDALRACGFNVYRLDQPLDLLLSRAGRTWIAEVKQEGKKLKPHQAEFIKAWRDEVPVFRSIEDVMEFAQARNIMTPEGE